MRGIVDFRTLTARIHHEEGSYWAEVVELPGCFASGDTLDELREALQESVSLYLTDDCDGAKLEEHPRAPDRPPARSLEVDEMKILVGA